MIETAINSVRVSLRLKKLDELDEILARKFSRFLMLRADNFVILRRKPIAGVELLVLDPCRGVVELLAVHPSVDEKKADPRRS